MSNPLAPDRVFALVDRLKAVIEDFADRSNRLSSDHAARLSKERQRCQAAIEEQERNTAAALAEAEAVFQREQAAAEANFHARKARIGRAYQSTREQRLKEIEDRTGALKYELQKKTLQAERDRDAALAAAAQAAQVFRDELAREQTRLSALEGRAQRGFKGYGGFTRGFFSAYEHATAPALTEPQQLLEDLRRHLTLAGERLDAFGRIRLLGWLRHWPLWLVLCAALAGLGPLLQQAGYSQVGYGLAGGAAALLFGMLMGLRALAVRQARLTASEISEALARARQAHDACARSAAAHYAGEVERIQTEFVDKTQAFDQALKRASSVSGQERVGVRMETDERTVRITARHEQLYRARCERREREYAAARETFQRVAQERVRALRRSSEETLQKLEANLAEEWRQLEEEWRAATGTLGREVEALNAEAARLFPPWEHFRPGDWRPPEAFAHAAKFAELRLALDQLCRALPRDPRLALPAGLRLSLPLCLTFPEQGSVLFETKNTGQQQVIGALNNLILRLLAGAPPGRLAFTILDPVGLGQNFAGVMHLADYEEQIISSRIWTQSGQIEQKLGELNEHMEKVIQMYLRNEYATIAEYNAQAGVIAEKYHFLVIADFPAGFTDTAARRLLSIAASGARCGVYMLIHWDQRQPLPQDFLPDELRKHCLGVAVRGADFVVTTRQMPGLELALEAPPAAELATEFIHQVGLRSRDSSRVEVPFDHVAPAPEEMWSADTTQELRVAIGRTGATKLQYLEIGRGTCQHGLIAGKTGSGKSTLFHVIITNLALWASPEQVEFYLVDFKKGVEFKAYAQWRLPHARVVAIESDREFAVSVLQRVDEELKRRGDLFRDLGVQDLPGYKRAGGKEPLPRCLLIVDEFQEFFVEDDRLAQTASLLLDRIVRQGRAFGIHVLLGSQTLGGAYTVARTTLGQMVIRIALQCNEADAYLIMDDTNPAPRLLSRPGEGIYNDAAGALEGNSPFQVVWLPEQVRDQCLARVRAKAEACGKAHLRPIVFEGNAPADVRENTLLAELLAAPLQVPPAAPRIWLGAPNSIKGPTEAVFLRQSGNNLLVVGQREEAMLAILSVGLISLSAQFPRGTARFIVCDTTPPGSPQRDYLEEVCQLLSHPVERVKVGEVDGVMRELAAEMKQRAGDPAAESAPPRFLFIHGLQKISRLRYEEDYGFSSSEAEAAANPAAVLNQMICEGTRLGYHVIATCDTYNNVNRFLSRKALSEFEMRVLFQMSANDSASLMDNPRASQLGLHRAIFYNSQEGHLETFRPYALPGRDWLEEVREALARANR